MTIHSLFPKEVPAGVVENSPHKPVKIAILGEISRLFLWKTL